MEDPAFLELGAIRHALSLHRIRTAEEIAACSVYQLLRMYGIRRRHIALIEAFLSRRGLGLNPAADPRVRDDRYRSLGRRKGDSSMVPRPTPA